MYYAKERDHVKEVTAHWVDKDWKLQKRIIKFRALSPLYDVRSCTHILNLIVKAGLELVDDVVGKFRNRIKYIKKSRIHRKKNYDVADESFHLNVIKKFHQDVCVRWNSTYLMFESALYYKDVLDYWGQRDKDYLIFTLSYEEWRNVAILCKIFKVFYDVTCVFSGLRKPFLTILNSCLMSMLRTPNPRLPLWSGVPIFQIIILLILVCINSMLIGLIWKEIMMRVIIINDTYVNPILRVKGHSWTFIWKN
ncbi:hypothetical protein Gotri_005918 [Gossypium trilobum]|uniref:hAT-like transposase RNase-H fold domain-containing protein n=1 Tax=Gossypium trilobum TaxID=34281 RepID=A0A7J9EY89_9ROSI|nr:hypothetical protein [Gossypium trilobum]